MLLGTDCSSLPPHSAGGASHGDCQHTPAPLHDTASSRPRPLAPSGLLANRGPLTKDELAAYERDGFLILPGLFSRSEIDRAGQWIDELAGRTPVVGEQMVYLEDSLLAPGQKVISRIERFLEHHPPLRAFCHDARLTDRVEQLLGEPGVLFKEKINFKLPGGSGFKPHQDIQPGWDDYTDYFLSVLVTIDESTAANGCLELAAGQHQRGWIGRRGCPLEGAELAGLEFVQYPLQPGDVALFDCFVPHQSQANLTDRPRRNLYLTYNRQSGGDHRQRYFADKRKSFPPDNEPRAGHDVYLQSLSRPSGPADDPADSASNLEDAARAAGVSALRRVVQPASAARAPAVRRRAVAGPRRPALSPSFGALRRFRPQPGAGRFCSLRADARLRRHLCRPGHGVPPAARSAVGGRWSDPGLRARRAHAALPVRPGDLQRDPVFARRSSTLGAAARFYRRALSSARQRGVQHRSDGSDSLPPGSSGVVCRCPDFAGGAALSAGRQAIRRQAGQRLSARLLGMPDRGRLHDPPLGSHQRHVPGRPENDAPKSLARIAEAFSRNRRWRLRRPVLSRPAAARRDADGPDRGPGRADGAGARRPYPFLADGADAS